MPAAFVALGRTGDVDVITPEETAVSSRSVTVAAVAVSLSTALVVPGLLVPGYARIVAGALLSFALAFALRVAAVTPLAALRRDPPPPPESLPAVSVVVTAYNEADVLPATLAACRALDYPDDALEIVVVYEAASEDGTREIARAAAARDPRVEALERPGPPGGKAAATNHALAHASGEVIAILDADQRPEPGALRRAVRWFEDDDVSCVKGRCFGTNPDASPLALCATVERSLAERAEFYARDRLSGFAFFTGGQAFVRRDALPAGGFDESILLEDLEMAYRLQRAGGEVRVDPQVVTYERNPVTFTAWWNQRKRWARGGMQVARRYLGRNLLSGPPSLPARLDFAATLGGLLALPVLAAASPLLALALWNGSAAFSGWTLAATAIVVGVGLAAPYLVFAIDARDGRAHAVREYAAPPLLGPYVAVQSCAVLAAFVEEFFLRRARVYVTSTTGT